MAFTAGNFCRLFDTERRRKSLVLLSSLSSLSNTGIQCVPFQIKSYDNNEQIAIQSYLLSDSLLKIASLLMISASLFPFSVCIDFHSFHGLLTRRRHTFPF